MAGFPLLGTRVVGYFYDRFKACCELERSGNGWYETVTANWDGYIAELEEWQRRQQFDSDEEKKSEKTNFVLRKETESLPYPWPEPPETVPPRHGLRYYQILYVCACLIGPQNVVSILETVPVLQAILKQLLM